MENLWAVGALPEARTPGDHSAPPDPVSLLSKINDDDCDDYDDEINLST